MGTQRDGFGFFFGLLLGSLVGASVAIIMAPQSGDETREMIKDRAKDAKDKASDFAKDLKEDSKELLERAKTARQEAAKAKPEEHDGGAFEADSPEIGDDPVTEINEENKEA